MMRQLDYERLQAALGDIWLVWASDGISDAQRDLLVDIRVDLCHVLLMEELEKANESRISG